MNPRLPIDFRHRAFTLIEVLLAVSVFAIVLAAINTVFYAAMRLRQKTLASLDNSLPLHESLAILRRDLQSAVAPAGRLSGPMQSAAAGGLSQTSGGLQFYTSTGRLYEDAPWGDIQKVFYQLRPSTNGAAGTGLDLVRTVTRNLLPAAQEEVVDQWLLSGVGQMDFEYYDGVQWRDSWDGSVEQTSLPRAVRVRIQLADEDQTRRRVQEPFQLLVPLLAQARTNRTQSAQQ